MAFWHWFQSTYDKIDAWDFPPETKDFIKKLSDILPKKLTNGLIGYIGYIYKKRGVVVAQAFIKKLIKALSSILPK